mmetsp:Transcript_76797/g.94264  ORF Transcript_76797/g.94264 Transcript_76797/m.94264 type:complete len:114 (+) Transcript_76797:591-932(+)
MRKAASASSATQVIEHNGDKIKITITNAKGTYGYSCEIGTGKAGPEIEYKDADKKLNKSTSQWDNNNKTSYTETIIVDGKTYKAKRFIQDNEMRLQIVNSKGKDVVRIFALKK